MQKKSPNTIFEPPGRLCVALSSKLKYFLHERCGEEHTPETQEVPEISEIYRFLFKTMEAVNKHWRVVGRLTELSTACMVHSSPKPSFIECCTRAGITFPGIWLPSSGPF